MQLVLDTNGLKVSVRNDCFYIQTKTAQRLISPQRVSSIVIVANVLISSKAMVLACQYDIPFTLLPVATDSITLLSIPHSQNAELRKKQWIQQSSNASFDFIKKCILWKIEQQQNLLLKLATERATPTQLLRESGHRIKEISIQLSSVVAEKSNFANILMGYEGSIAKIYWQGISQSLPIVYQFEKRSRRPATDLFNAALNYLYALLENTVQSSILSCRLDPFCGILHATAHGHKALVYDMMEPFRPWVDRLLVELIRNNEFVLVTANQIHPQKGVLLTKEQRKLLTFKYNEMLNTRRKWNNQITYTKNHILSTAALFAKKQQEQTA